MYATEHIFWTDIITKLCLSSLELYYKFYMFFFFFRHMYYLCWTSFYTYISLKSCVLHEWRFLVYVCMWVRWWWWWWIKEKSASGFIVNVLTIYYLDEKKETKRKESKKHPFYATHSGHVIEFYFYWQILWHFRGASCCMLLLSKIIIDVSTEKKKKIKESFSFYFCLRRLFQYIFSLEYIVYR